MRPYCLKASLGRWYVLAVKENKDIDVEHYFDDAFGIWVNKESCPAKDITITVPISTAHYWRTLPLHHSQREVGADEETVTFSFHVALTTDFMGELRRWDVKID